jgi:hypothetical protein
MFYYKDLSLTFVFVLIKLAKHVFNIREKNKSCFKIMDG